MSAQTIVNAVRARSEQISRSGFPNGIEEGYRECAALVLRLAMQETGHLAPCSQIARLNVLLADLQDSPRSKEIRNLKAQIAELNRKLEELEE